MLSRLLRSLAGKASVARPELGAVVTVRDRPIVFVTAVPEPRPIFPTDGVHSSLASIRLRVLAPARELAQRSPVVLAPLPALLDAQRREALGNPRAVVIGKLSSAEVSARRRELEGFLRWLREDGAKLPLYADVSDDYAALGRSLGDPFLERYQQALAAACTMIVPCEALADRFRATAPRGVFVIEDPWESPRANPPRAAQNTPLRLCWFGNVSEANLPPVEDGLGAVARRLGGGPPLTLDFVTAAVRRDLALGLAERLGRINPAFELRFVEWSPEATWRAIDEADFVILPQAADDWGRVKSHNRLVEAIRGGRLAVCSPIPSYRELADFAWVGDDLGEGVAWALAHPAQAVERVTAGQRYIARRFAPAEVGHKWARVLGHDPGRDSC
jgi:hypothetical protein